MRRRTKKAQPPIYSIYAIYDNDIDDRIYKISYCYAYKLPQIQRYYANNQQRHIDIIFEYFTTKFTKIDIQTYINELDDKLQPVIIHSYSHEGNRKRILQAKNGDYFHKSLLDRNGKPSIEKFILECIGDVFNAPYDIETLQSEQYTVYEKETQPDYIPFDFWNYGYKITDLPEHLQQRYERYTHD